MKKILLTLAMLVLAMGAGALTLEECVLRGSSPRGIGAMQPSKSDGRYFWAPGYPMNPTTLRFGLSWNFFD